MSQRSTVNCLTIHWRELLNAKVEVKVSYVTKMGTCHKLHQKLNTNAEGLKI